jgi:hypothetical protein
MGEDIILTLFVIAFSLFWAGMGLFMKKHPELIAGYNTMPKEKLKNVDIQAIGNLFCKGFRVMAVSMAVLYLVLRLPVKLPIPIAMNGFLAPIFLGTPILMAMAQKYDKNPRGRIAKYLPAGIMALLYLIAVAMYFLN